MSRPPRADEANGLYHALNRGNSRATIFHKEDDYEAFERILADGLSRYAVRRSVQRGSPFGASSWLDATTQRLGLASTLRPRGRPRVRSQKESENNES